MKPIILFKIKVANLTENYKCSNVTLTFYVLFFVSKCINSPTCHQRAISSITYRKVAQYINT